MRKGSGGGCVWCVRVCEGIAVFLSSPLGLLDVWALHVWVGIISPRIYFSGGGPDWCVCARVITGGMGLTTRSCFFLAGVVVGIGSRGSGG